MSNDPQPVMRPMVRWFDPGVLLLAAWRAVVAQLFGQYADARRAEAVARPDDAAALDPAYDYAGRRDANGDLWFDYTADTGDGWNPAATVAHVLARDSVELEEGKPLPRGRFLVLGGDQVYPVASREDYKQKLVAPFAAALPEGSLDPEPDLYAVPGNHDWYDGLGAFFGLFAARQPGAGPGEPARPGRVIGGWRTQQTRSYFALRLADDLWLWGMDTQLEAYVDGPQVRYFIRVASTLMQPGSRVILALPQPSWLPADGEPNVSLKNFFFVRRTLILEMGHRLVMALSGDDHIFTCHRDEETLYVTCGGGGAFTGPTHLFPPTLEMDGPAGERLRPQEVAPPHPDRPQSRGLMAGVLLLPATTPLFTVFLAILAALAVWGLDGAAPGGLDGRLSTTLEALYHSPFAASVLAGAGGLLIAFSAGRARALWAGLVHAAVQVAVLLAVVTLAAGGLHRFGLILAVGVIGGLLFSAIFAAYLYLAASIFRLHTDDVFSGLSLQDYKAFLRIRVDKAGRVSLWGVGIPRSCRSWTFARRPDGQWTAAPAQPIALKPLVAVDLEG
jgi:hypothetical protein